jgi:hypothetical protein
MLISPDIGNSLYFTLPFLKKNGNFPPKVSSFDSRIVFLIDDTFGLKHTLNYLSPSLKNISSKSTCTGSASSLNEYRLSV